VKIVEILAEGKKPRARKAKADEALGAEAAAAG
jgi:hypothetical protein